MRTRAHLCRSPTNYLDPVHLPLAPCPTRILCYGLFLAFGVTGCRDSGSEVAWQAPAFSPVTFADSVAAAHGFGTWAEVEDLSFTFAVDIDDTNRVMRSWRWFPMTDSVVSTTPQGTIAYTRSATLDSVTQVTDAKFINDTYWLLMPFYLVWSEEGYESSVTYRDTMPLSLTIGTKLTVQYRPQGGYTPGDAYDLYVDDDYRLREWTYRKGGQREPSMVLDWSAYEDENGLLLPADHRGDGALRIYHPNTTVTLAR